MTSIPTSLPTCSLATQQSAMIGHSPLMLSRPDGQVPSAQSIESLLTQWFEAPTLLFSSGRAACHVFLAEMKLHPYRHNIRVPEFLSRCILNALTLNAFPVRHMVGDAVLYYHQYGFRQSCAPAEQVVIEDACHAFFSRPGSGARRWLGQAAVVSLPKFFATNGPAGALIVPDDKLYERIKERRDKSADIDSVLANWRREVIISATNYGQDSQLFKLIESAYALLTEFPKIDPVTLVGFPTKVEELAAIGNARRQRLALFAEGLGDRFPHFLFQNGLDDLPYALPVFHSSTREDLMQTDKALSSLGVHCGVYSIDVARNLYSPEFRPSVLLPCHQDVPLQLVQEICAVINPAR